MFTRFNIAALWELCGVWGLRWYLKITFHMQSLSTDVNTKKTLFKQNGLCTVRRLKTWRRIKSGAIQTSKKEASAIKPSSGATEITFQRYFRSLERSSSSFDGVEKHLECMWVNPAHWKPLWQSKKQIQNEQHFAWDWNGYTHSTTNVLHKNS